MLERNYEKFRGGPAARLGQLADPRVTINRRSLIYLNRKAYETLGSPKAVALYYSREDDSIAIEPAYPRFAENFPVIQKQEGYAVHAATFCRHFGISVPKTERFLSPDLTDEGALILTAKPSPSAESKDAETRADPKKRVRRLQSDTPHLWDLRSTVAPNRRHYRLGTNQLTRPHVTYSPLSQNRHLTILIKCPSLIKSANELKNCDPA